MANNIVLNSGSGGSTLATEQNGAAEQYQKIKITDGTGGAFTNMAAVTAASALKVDASGAAVPITDNGANLHVQGAGASGAAKAGNPVQVGGVFNTTQPTVTTGQGVELQATARGALIVATGTDALTITPSGTQTVTGTVTTTPPANASTNVAQVAGTAADVNSGVKSAGTLRVVLATDQPALTNKLLVTPDSVALPANQSVNVSQINAVTPLMGNGVTGTGSQRVTIASDNTAFTVNAAQSGTWTVQPGNTQNTTAWLTQVASATTGGLSMSSTLLAASNNLTSVKASAGTVYGIQAFGTGSAPYWLKLYNKASAPVVATDASLIVKRILVPANATAANGAGVVVPINDIGLAFSSGIAFSCVGLQADADTTNTAAAGAVNIDYK